MARPKPFAHLVGEEAAATTPFEPNDVGLAARARAEGLELVSGSVREFRRAAGWRPRTGARHLMKHHLMT